MTSHGYTPMVAPTTMAQDVRQLMAMTELQKAIEEPGFLRAGDEQLLVFIRSRILLLQHDIHTKRARLPDE